MFQPLPNPPQTGLVRVGRSRPPDGVGCKVRAPHLHVAQRHGFGQRRERVPLRHELVGEVARESHIHHRPRNRRVVQLLRGVDLVAVPFEPSAPAGNRWDLRSQADLPGVIGASRPRLASSSRIERQRRNRKSDEPRARCIGSGSVRARGGRRTRIELHTVGSPDPCDRTGTAWCSLGASSRLYRPQVPCP